jgi:hypothetical protein
VLDVAKNRWRAGCACGLASVAKFPPYLPAILSRLD